MLFVREDIPSNLLTIEEKPIESNSNIKWLVNCSYNPHKNSTGNHLNRISESLDLFSSDYENMIFLGNATDDKHHMKSFCKNYGLKHLIRQPTCYKNQPTCYKNPSNPACIDFILTNVSCSFQSTWVVQTGLSDLHLVTLIVMRKSFKKYQPKTRNYRSFKNFSNEKYRETLTNNLSKENIIHDDNGFQRSCHISLDALNKHAPCKKKHARGNQMPFFNKELLKAIMTRTKLQNIFQQNRSEENRIHYTKQRSFCVFLLRKPKKETL